MNRKQWAAGVAGAVLLSFAAAADSPLAPPAPHFFNSADGRFWAYSSLSPDVTMAAEAKSGRRLWSIPHWFRSGQLANDGIHFIATYGGLNLVPKGTHPPDLPMIRFFESGELIATVSLADLISQEDLLRFPTASHYHWGQFLGFDDHERFRLVTSTESEFAFDLRGRLVEKRSGALHLFWKHAQERFRAGEYIVENAFQRAHAVVKEIVVPWPLELALFAAVFALIVKRAR